MMTNAQHDNAWLDVMERQIPSGVEDLRLLLNQIGYRNQLEVLKELHDGKLITDREYYSALISYIKPTKLYGEEEHKELKSRLNTQYPKEES